MKHVTTFLVLSLVCFLGLSESAPAWAGKPQPLSFELLEKTVYSKELEPKFPAGLSELEGKQVRLSGFMIPYDDPEKIMRLLLVKTPGGCFFCNLPLPNGVVLVRLSASAPPLAYTVSQVTFEGILHLWHAEMRDEDVAKGFFYTLDEAKVADSTYMDRFRNRVATIMAALKKRIAAALDK